MKMYHSSELVLKLQVPQMQLNKLLERFGQHIPLIPIKFLCFSHTGRGRGGG